jgi:hypothetical protein
MLVVLYAGAGIAQTHMSGELSGRTLLEFSGVAAAAILLVLGVGILPR